MSNAQEVHHVSRFACRFVQESTGKEIDKVIREEGIDDTGVTRAMLNHTDPLTPCHIYSAVRVQRALLRKRRNEKFRALHSSVVKQNSRTAGDARESRQRILLIFSEEQSVGCTLRLCLRLLHTSL
jgi:hypothetical protein